MSFYCIMIFYLRHSVSLRLLFGVFGKVVISASRRMFVNNSSIFFGALSSYFKAGAGAAVHQCRFDSSAGKKTRYAKFGRFVLARTECHSSICFINEGEACGLLSAVWQVHHLQLDGATFELDPERMVDNLQSIKEDVSSLVLLFLIVDICPLFTSNCRVYHETGKQSSYFVFLLQKRSHLQPHDFHVQLASGREISSAKANPNTYYILPTTNISNNYKNKK